jgi:hypothetical protein
MLQAENNYCIFFAREFKISFSWRTYDMLQLETRTDSLKAGASGTTCSQSRLLTRNCRDRQGKSDPASGTPTTSFFKAIMIMPQHIGAIVFPTCHNVLVLLLNTRHTFFQQCCGSGSGRIRIWKNCKNALKVLLQFYDVTL